MQRPFRSVVASSVALLGALVVSAIATESGCTNTTTTNIDLVSGIQINTELLLDDGNIPCSNTSSQAVYKYLAIAINDLGDIAGAGVFDCFANGVIGNLPGTDGGALNFAVWIYAYNPQDYAVANEGNALVNAAQTLNGVTQVDGSVIPVPATSVPDGGTFSGRFTSKLSTLCLTQATWTATCSAQAQATILTQADCGPLSLEPRGKPDTCTLPILLPDGGKDAH
jgi:hypothetical protein